MLHPWVNEDGRDYMRAKANKYVSITPASHSRELAY